LLIVWGNEINADYRALSLEAKLRNIGTFKRHYNLSRRKKTGCTQLLPRDAAEKVANYNAMLFAAHAEHKFTRIVVADETFVLQQSAAAYTLAERGSKQVKLKVLDEKAGMTVMLAAMSELVVNENGEGTWRTSQLQPMVIVKAVAEGTVQKKLAKKCAGKVFARASPNGWMNAELMLDWVRQTLPVMPARRKGLVVIDLFAAHRTEAVRKMIEARGYVVMFVPGGCTSEVQVHDVCVNRPLKAGIVNWYTEVRAKAGDANKCKRDEVCNAVASIYGSKEMQKHCHKGILKLVVQPMTTAPTKEESGAALTHKIDTERALHVDETDALEKALDECCFLAADEDGEEDGQLGLKMAAIVVVSDTEDDDDVEPSLKEVHTVERESAVTTILVE
jgi:hypothetical protein